MKWITRERKFRRGYHCRQDRTSLAHGIRQQAEPVFLLYADTYWKRLTQPAMLIEKLSNLCRACFITQHTWDQAVLLLLVCMHFALLLVNLTYSAGSELSPAI